MSMVTILFRSPARYTALAKSNVAIEYGEDFENNEGEWTKKVEISTRKKFLAVDKAWTKPPQFWKTKAKQKQPAPQFSNKQKTVPI